LTEEDNLALFPFFQYRLFQAWSVFLTGLFSPGQWTHAHKEERNRIYTPSPNAQSFLPASDLSTGLAAILTYLLPPYSEGSWQWDIRPMVWNHTHSKPCPAGVPQVGSPWETSRMRLPFMSEQERATEMPPLGILTTPHVKWQSIRLGSLLLSP
jgi:hypothetical protein